MGLPRNHETTQDRAHSVESFYFGKLSKSRLGFTELPVAFRESMRSDRLRKRNSWMSEYALIFARSRFV